MGTNVQSMPVRRSAFSSWRLELRWGEFVVAHRNLVDASRLKAKGEGRPVRQKEDVMLRIASDLLGRRVLARDGVVGSIGDLVFDDERWCMRYIVVNTGSRSAVVSAAAVIPDVDPSSPMRVGLSRRQIDASPNVNADLAISRRGEAELALYYGQPCYWRGPFLWGMALYPRVIPWGAVESESASHARPDETHLCTLREVIGFSVESGDGVVGSVDDLVIDSYTWGIVRVVSDSNQSRPGRLGLVMSDRIVGIDRISRTMRVDCRRLDFPAACASS
jgi:hypothetical protein